MPYKDPEKKRAYDKRYRQTSRAKELHRINQAAYVERNREKHQSFVMAWQKENVGKVRGYKKTNILKRKFRVPAWADLQAINFFYECCPAGCHVDHTIPMNGQMVSGLHVAENLQWLPASENLVKGNSYDSS